MKREPRINHLPGQELILIIRQRYLEVLLVCFIASFLPSCNASDSLSSVEKKIVKNVRKAVITRADSLLAEPPVTITAFRCPLSAGEINDYWSPGDYWWPDPSNPEGPYIRRDGETNPDFCYDHRLSIIRLSEITATLTSAWLLTGNSRYAHKVEEHLVAWFVNPSTRMNPHMLYSQAIPGRVTGRGVGLIDAYHFVEVARSIDILTNHGEISADGAVQIKEWFTQFLAWMTTHSYGIDEMNRMNNHGTCWVAAAAAFARLTNNREEMDFCRERIKTVLLPQLMATDGSFPNELQRTKPYGYSLFHMDAFANAARILSTPEDNLWNYTTPDGKSLRKGMEFIYPFIADKSQWPYDHDIYIWEEWPVRQSCLLFAGLAFNKEEYLESYLQLPASGYHSEVIRNLPVRHPVIWLMSAP